MNGNMMAVRMIEKKYFPNGGANESFYRGVKAYLDANPLADSLYDPQDEKGSEAMIGMYLAPLLEKTAQEAVPYLENFELLTQFSQISDRIFAAAMQYLQGGSPDVRPLETELTACVLQMQANHVDAERYSALLSEDLIDLDMVKGMHNVYSIRVGRRLADERR